MRSKSIFLVAVVQVAILRVIWSQQNSQCARYAVVVRNAHYTELQSLKNPENNAIDNAVAETINCLCKEEVAQKRGLDAVENATLEWLDW